MTPLTVKAGFVSAFLDAAYHIELAGGGHYKAAALRSKVAEIQKQIPARVGIMLNSLYINPRQFTFIQGSSYVDNALRRILVPRVGQKVVVKYAGSLPLSVTVYGAARSYGEHVPTFKALSIVFYPETKLIDLTLFEERQDVAVPLSLQFRYCPSQGFAPIHEIASVNKTNQHLPANSQLHVSLHNGLKTFVITGPPKALFGLVTSLRKARAQSGLDQSKTPFSQRKPVFTIRFLLVGVPYHSAYLNGVTDIVEEDLEDEGLWEAKVLKIPVYNTEDGISVSLSNLGAYKLIFYV